MKKATVLFIGLICIVLFGFSITASRFGDGVNLPRKCVPTGTP
jgi:hypothetical protein